MDARDLASIGAVGLTGGKYTIPTYIDMSVADRGRMVWSLWHRYRGCDPVFLETIEHLIPRRGCNCVVDYFKLKEAHPPDFSSPEAFFAWGVLIHNLVNETLGKEIVDLEVAKIIWERG